MSKNKTCPDCGIELPPDAPAGVCPKCLLKTGIDDAPGHSAGEVTLVGDPDVNQPDVTEPSAGRGGNPAGIPEIGARVQYFGDYELLDEIARGGMGVVYKARQVRLNRVVALKMILAGQFASDADIQRFQTEAESAAQLDHPGIVPIFEVGEHEGHHFFSMGLVDGESLAHRIAEAPMAPEEAAGRIDQVNESADIYSLGAVLYLTLTGRPPFAADNPLDTLMQVIEREAVPPRELNPSIPKDLDTICLKCLEKDRSRRYRNTTELAEELERFRSGEPILARPIGRIARAGRWCRRKPAAATLAGTLTLIFTVVLPIVLVIQLGLIRQRDSAIQDWIQALSDTRAAKREADEARLKAEKERQAAVKAQQKEEQQRLIADKQRDLAEQRELVARRYLYAADKRLNGVVLWDLQDQEEVAFLSGHDDAVVDIEFTNDGNRIVTAGADGSSRVWNTNSRELVTTFTEHDLHIVDVAVSPDGRHVASGSQDKTIRIWDLETGSERQVLRGHTDLVRSVDFHPDGSALASGGKDKSVRIWNIAAGNDAVRFQADSEHAIRCLAFLPNGDLVTGSSGGGILAWSTSSTAEIERFDGMRGTVLSVNVSPVDAPRVVACGLGGSAIHTWSGEDGPPQSIDVEGRGIRMSVSPDGRLAAVVDLRGRVSVVDLESQQQTMMVERHDGPVFAVTWHPDGQRLATGSFDSSIRIWDAASHSLLRTLEGHKLAVCALAFNSDGSLLASGSASAMEMDQRRYPPTPGTIRLWNMAEETPSNRVLSGHSGGVLCLDFSPDDRTLASASHDQTIRLWEPITGSQVMSLRADSGPFWSLEFSSDGTQLAAGADDGSVHVWETSSIK